MALSYDHGAIQWLSADAATTVYTVSGLSFQPKALRFYCVGIASATDANSATVNQRRCVGFATGTSARCAAGTLSIDNGGSAFTSMAVRDDCCVLTTNNTVSDGRLDLNSITSDGFTLIVDDAAPVDLTVFWEAWGGSDITVATVGSFAEPAATGDQDYTVTGFVAGATDQVVMFAGTQNTGAIPVDANDDSGFSVGFATGGADANNIHVMGNSDFGSANMDTDGYCKTGECLSMCTVAGGNPSARAKLTQFGTDNFRLNWIARAVTGRKIIFMAIKGGNWTAGAYTINGNSGSATATVSGLSYAPIGLSLIGCMTAEDAAGTSHIQDRLGLGSGTSTSSRRGMGVLDEDGTANTEIDATVQYDQVLCFPDAAGGLAAAYDINAMNSDGFQIIVDTAGGVASEWQGYLTFGSAAAGVTPAPLLPGSQRYMKSLAA